MHFCSSDPVFRTKSLTERTFQNTQPATTTSTPCSFTANFTGTEFHSNCNTVNALLSPSPPCSGPASRLTDTTSLPRLSKAVSHHITSNRSNPNPVSLSSKPTHSSQTTMGDSLSCPESTPVETPNSGTNSRFKTPNSGANNGFARHTRGLAPSLGASSSELSQ
ncbi:hypothetical protein V6N11_051521 [Hibiscus sabdariffa]|uniref:Uncharacterized protein n=1 Tax=Hibiscus sabdariffa TaxID=183260 RepID=A0ABR2U7C1_9ROSI